MQDWSARQAELSRLAQTQLFFIGGAPRSGTTWLQRILDSHPDICCAGEGHFGRELAKPLEQMMAARGRAIDEKNRTLFGGADGYKLPLPDDTEFLLGSAILLALHQQSQGGTYRAIGEKTPENVFLFPRLKRLFSNARLICIARDPRDVLASAWHFFHGPGAAIDEATAKTAFLRRAFASLTQGARVMLAMAEQYPSDCMIVTYETLRRTPAPCVASLFRFLGVADDEETVGDCVARTAFSAMARGREAGTEQPGAFLRKGVVGDWSSTLTPEMNALVLDELGWMFPHFGWQP